MVSRLVRARVSHIVSNSQSRSNNALFSRSLQTLTLSLTSLVVVIVVGSFVEEKQNGISVSSIIRIMKQCLKVLSFCLDRMCDARRAWKLDINVAKFRSGL